MFEVAPCINIAIVQAESSCAIYLRLKVRVLQLMAMDAVELRSRHIIPVPIDHIMKVAASQLSLIQPLYLSPLAPLLSANQSPSTLGSIPLGPIPLSLTVLFLNAACALPPTIFAQPFCIDTAHRHSVLTVSVAGDMPAPQLQCTDCSRSVVIATVLHLPQLQCTYRSHSALTEVDVVALGELHVSAL